MANLTNSFKRELLDGILGVAPIIIPDVVYIAMFTDILDDTGNVSSELNKSGYTRISLEGKFSPAFGTSGASYNTDTIYFNEALEDWGTINSIGIMKSGTIGADDMMMWSVLDVPSVIGINHIPKFNIGDLMIQVD